MLFTRWFKFLCFPDCCPLSCDWKCEPFRTFFHSDTEMETSRVLALSACASRYLWKAKPSRQAVMDIGCEKFNCCFKPLKSDDTLSLQHYLAYLFVTPSCSLFSTVIQCCWLTANHIMTPLWKETTIFWPSARGSSHWAIETLARVWLLYSPGALSKKYKYWALGQRKVKCRFSSTFTHNHQQFQNFSGI